MHTLKLAAILTAILIPCLCLSEDNQSVPLTMVGSHSLGPQKLGNLPPVVTPPLNSQQDLKIKLGKLLYFDTRLSNDNTISCATCHNPTMGWSDEGPTSIGIGNQKGGRRAPPVVNAAYSPLQFWDGRAPTLEEQAKGPIANPIEMGNTHEVMIRTVGDIPGYVELFEKVYGSSKVTLDMVADAIAAFERTVVTTDSPFDRFVKGEESALTQEEKFGLEIFNGKGHCTSCHWGPYFSDGRFHNIGVLETDPLNPDLGRYVVTNNPKDKGAFKTPTVRDAALRAPYMHNGSEKSLEDFVELYNEGDRNGNPNLDPLIVPLGLSQREKKALVAFMKSAMISLNPEVANVIPPTADEMPQ